MKAKKRVTSAVALVLAAVLLALSGTFAWQSISQPAKNEMLVTVNPGGRLHDDFDGENKDVYVENFTDSENDGVPIYARVRLDEYMEIGSDAGQPTAEGKKAESVVEGADFDNVNTWTTYVPGVDSVFDTYRDLIHDGGQTTYMPTFNKNKDSLKADVNGTYDGTDPDDDEHYDDYVDHTDPANAEKTAEAVYDIDEDNDDEKNPVTGVDVEYKEETHTVQKTIDGTVITMAEWLKNPVKGDFWVWDEDGWAYWANPIQPGEATGLLLDGIAPKNGIANGDLYYAINVVGQFFTSGDAGWKNNSGIYSDPDKKPTKNAEKLLDEIGVDIGKAFVTVTAANNATTVKQGRTLQFTAEVKRGAVPVEGATVTWSLDKAVSGCSVNQDGVLTVGSSVPVGTEVTVKAVYTNDDGTQTEDTATVKVETGVFITISPTSATVKPGSSQSFTATVKRGSSTISGADITWSVSNSSCSITSSGVLTIPSSVSGGTTMTVTATYDDEGTKISARASVTAKSPEKASYTDTVKSITPGSSSTVTIDGTEFYVLAKTSDSALLLAKYSQGSMGFGGKGIWKDSSIRNYLNGTWINSKPTLSKFVKQTTIYTPVKSGATEVYATYDKAFLLSQEDVFASSGNSYNQDASVKDERCYTAGAKLTIPNNNLCYESSSSTEAGIWMLRNNALSGSGSYECVEIVSKYGGEYLMSIDVAYTYVRPALWVYYTI